MIAISKNDFVDAISKEFIYAQTTAEALYYAFKTKQNIILHGPGGHGKSDIAEAAIKLISDPARFYTDTYIASCSGEMSAAPFVGYTDIKTLREQGRRVTILDDTVFLKNEYAILEEGLSAPDELIISLRDGLQRGSLCIDGVCMPNKLKSLIICTNVEPSKWAGKDPSRLALLGRFAFQHEVKWPSYKASDFEEMFTMRGVSDLVVAQMAEICHKNDFPISPRDAMKMNEIYTVGGISALTTFRGMTEPTYSALVAFQASIPYVRQIETFEEQLAMINPVQSQGERMRRIAILNEHKNKIKQIPTDGVYSGKLKDCLVKLQQLKDGVFTISNELTL